MQKKKETCILAAFQKKKTNLDRNSGKNRSQTEFPEKIESRQNFRRKSNPDRISGENRIQTEFPEKSNPDISSGKNRIQTAVWIQTRPHFNEQSSVKYDPMSYKHIEKI